MSTTPDQPQEPERKPEPSQEEAADARDALRDLADKPRADEAGPTAYSAVPPPLPRIGEPDQQQPQQSPYQEPQDQPPYGQQPYGQPQHGQPQYGQPQYSQPQHGQQAAYSGGPYGGQYQAAPPPPPQEAYGYPGTGLPSGMPPLADWGQRAGAFALDNGPAIVAGWVIGATHSTTVDVLFGILCFFGVIWAVINAVQAGRIGQSYGKRTLGIRLARFTDGQPVSAALGLLRLFLDWLFWVACVIPGALNLLWPLWDGKHQTWSDKITGSVVVRVR